jgi:signal transduction histidine kinase
LRLKSKLIVSTTVTLVLAVAAVSTVAHISFIRKSEADISLFREEIIARYKAELKHNVEIVYSDIEAKYRRGVEKGDVEGAV